MFLYVVIFQQMTFLFAVESSPTMIGLTVKKYHNEETTEHFFKDPGVLFCTTFGLSQCGLAGLLMRPLKNIHILI